MKYVIEMPSPLAKRFVAFPVPYDPHEPDRLEAATEEMACKFDSMTEACMYAELFTLRHYAVKPTETNPRATVRA